MLAFGLATAGSAMAATPGGPSRSLHAASRGDVCGGTTDARTTLQAMLAEVSGGTLIIDAGCTPLLSSPGAGAAALTLPSGTTLAFESDSSRLLLARRHCTSGHFVGAGCTVDADCRGGTCGCDVGAGEDCAFAPPAASPYTVIAAAPGARNVSVLGARVAVRQQDAWGRCVGTENGRYDGLPCVGKRDCSIGYCGPESGYPAGAGRVSVIDLTNAVGAKIRDGIVYDHRAGAFSFRVGGAGEISRVDNTQSEIRSLGHCEGGSTEGVACEGDFACGGVHGTYCTPPSRAVDDGIVLAGPNGRANDNKVGGTGTGIKIQGAFSKVRGNDFAFPPWGAYATTIYVDGQPATSGASQIIIDGNQGNGWYSCVRGNHLAYNVEVRGQRCYGSTGPKIVTGNAGWAILGGYLSWGAKVCIGGARIGQRCSAESPVRGSGCPGARAPYCAAAVAPAIQIGPTAADPDGVGVSHTEIIGVRLHNNLDGSGPLIAFPNGPRRCINGARRFRACTTNDTDGTTGCGSGASCDHLGCCVGLKADSTMIVGNHFYANGTGVVGIDMSALGNSATMAVDNLTISSNAFDQPYGGIGIKLPETAGAVTRVHVVANVFGSTPTPFANWADAFGQRVANTPIAFDQGGMEPLVVTAQNTLLRLGADISANSAVVLRRGTNNLQTAPTTATSIYGVASGVCRAGATSCRVIVSGPAICAVAASAAVVGGQKLVADGTTAGQFAPGTASGPSVAYATADKVEHVGASVPCFIQPSCGANDAPATEITLLASGTPSSRAPSFCVPGTGQCTGSDAAQGIVVPGALAIQRLQCGASTAPGPNESRTCSLRKNGAPVDGWSCTITGAARTCCVTSAARGCDVSGQPAMGYLPGDTITFETVPSAAPTASTWSVAASALLRQR